MACLEQNISLHVDNVQSLNEPSEGMKLARGIITELRSRGVDALSSQSDPQHLYSVLLGIAADYVKLRDGKDIPGVSHGT